MSKSHAKARRPANSVSQASRHVPLLIVPRTSSWTTISITSVTASTTCHSRSRPRAVAAVRVLRHKARQPGSGAPRGGKPQGRQNGPRSSDGASTGTPPAKRSGPRNGAPRDGQARREDSRATAVRPATTSLVRSRPCRTPRGPAPKIMHKESKADRFPTPEQLDQLPSRPRGEKPALLTRNR